MAAQRQHLVYETPTGFGCTRCTLWGRVLAVFTLWSCPPPDGQ